MYIDEDRKLVELGEKRKAEEKEREEFIEGLGLEKNKINAGLATSPAKQLEEGTFFRTINDAISSDEKDDKWNSEFIRFFEEETETKKQTPKDKAVQKRNETAINTYNTGEDWLMSDGGDDLAKGFINRARSSFGEGVEDFAYLLNDIAPWYKPAKTVLENNTAGSIGAKANEQFENAKSKTGDIGDRIIDLADNSAKTLGLSVLGPKAYTYVLGTEEGFSEYRRQRENGVSQELALKRALAKAGYSVASEKIDDYIRKNNPINDVLKGTNRSVDNFANDAYNRANKEGDLINDFYGALTKNQWRDYYNKLAQKGKLNSRVGDIYVYNAGGKIVLSQRVNITRDTNDYQVYEAYMIKGKDSASIAKSIAKVIEKGGDNYDAGKVGELFSSIIGNDVQSPVLARYDRASGTYIGSNQK